MNNKEMTARRRYVASRKPLGKSANENTSERVQHSKRRRPWGGVLSPATFRACSVLTVAVVIGVLWNWFDESLDPVVHRFLKQICTAADDAVFCHPSLTPSRRTQRATKRIKTGEVILVVARHLQLWDLDALRDPFIRNELLTARLTNGDALPNSAFLAAHLAYKRKLAIQQNSDFNPILRNYLTDVLPSYDDYAAFHPILWPEDELDSALGPYSSTFSHVMMFRRLVHDEYDAFTRVSTEFNQLIDRSEYLTARLNVLTRSFGTGPLPVTASGSEQPSQLTTSEIALYQNVGGLTLEHGSHAMVPVLDLYDHHASPNVGFSYDADRECFVISAIASIAPGFEVMDSYGKRTDSDLFARYGFVNGDGSEWTQASIALWHSVHASGSSQGLSKETSRILRYLQYDDGYQACIDPFQDDEAAWNFKKWKFAYLMSIAGKENHWVAQMSPRDKDSKPGRSTNGPITLEPPPDAHLDGDLQFNGNLLFGTCRLISLTHRDYNGNATRMIQDALRSESSVDGETFVLLPTNDALEYRTQMCIARFASTALSRFNTTLEEQRRLVGRLNREAFGTRKWTVEHIRLGEMQTLEMLKQVAFSALRKTFGENGVDNARRSDDPAFQMRDRPCHPDLLRPLLT
ncbi:hypothetical protein FisN_4Lh180 [Fistulifera solaris]|uniref:Uncharacterized protein n=1 Tax=Fistulifera solaris TaxID=1519565 RepID=A0A1Z5JZ10_FISSO|nr:hypothetical protein FisN_4Lh180 [Fistulifera solaris]|eukprot:GAX19237.1 hypothetical protein FisN_4Lh180 [Fistulifera solaris]